MQKIIVNLIVSILVMFLCFSTSDGKTSGIRIENFSLFDIVDLVEEEVDDAVYIASHYGINNIDHISIEGNKFLCVVVYGEKEYNGSMNYVQKQLTIGVKNDKQLSLVIKKDISYFEKGRFYTSSEFLNEADGCVIKKGSINLDVYTLNKLNCADVGKIFTAIDNNEIVTLPSVSFSSNEFDWNKIGYVSKEIDNTYNIHLNANFSSGDVLKIVIERDKVLLKSISKWES